MLLIIDRSKQEVTKIKEEVLKIQSAFQSQSTPENFEKKDPRNANQPQRI